MHARFPVLLTAVHACMCKTYVGLERDKMPNVRKMYSLSYLARTVNDGEYRLIQQNWFADHDSARRFREAIRYSLMRRHRNSVPFKVKIRIRKHYFTAIDMGGG